MKWRKTYLRKKLVAEDLCNASLILENIKNSIWNPSEKNGG